MEKQEAIYAGSGKTVSGQYGEFFKVTVCLSDLPKEHLFEYNGKKYVKLDISKKKETDQYGKNVKVQVDTWKPEAKTASFEAAPAAAQVPDDLPF
jgi:hypothetical protein